MKKLTVFGLVIFLIGAGLVAGFVVYNLLAADLPFFISLGLIGLGLGLVIIIISLILERIKDKKGAQ